MWKEMENLLDCGMLVYMYRCTFELLTAVQGKQKHRSLQLQHQNTDHLQTHTSKRTPACPSSLSCLSAVCAVCIASSSQHTVGKNNVFTHPSGMKMAERRGVTAAQAPLNWDIGRGTAVVPKSRNEESIKQSVSVSALCLSPAATTYPHSAGWAYGQGYACIGRTAHGAQDAPECAVFILPCSTHCQC
jgi:hypothetical protein